MTARRGRPDNTGRSSGKVSGRRGRAQRPPPGEPWVWLTRELLLSPAWRSLGINGRRFVDFLLVEHMNHAGTMNGDLRATYGQLEAAGIRGPSISQAVQDAELCGLVAAHRSGMRVATTYRLTFYPTADAPATNEWKALTAAMIAVRRGQQHQERAAQKQKSAYESVGSLPTEAKAESANLPTEAKADPAYESVGPSISSLVGDQRSAASPEAPAPRGAARRARNGWRERLSAAVLVEAASVTPATRALLFEKIIAKGLVQRSLGDWKVMDDILKAGRAARDDRALRIR